MTWVHSNPVAHGNPAGGAPLVQVVFTALIALTFLAPTLLMVAAERRGQRSPAGRVADLIQAITGLPAGRVRERPAQLRPGFRSAPAPYSAGGFPGVRLARLAGAAGQRDRHGVRRVRAAGLPAGRRVPVPWLTDRVILGRLRKVARSGRYDGVPLALGLLRRHGLDTRQEVNA
jgi:hypothetical protein